jgi:hypothetical protein
MNLPKYITLAEASELTGMKPRELERLVQAGKIQAIDADGEMMLNQVSLLSAMPTPKEETSEYKAVAHLKGNAIWLSEASRRYDIAYTTIVLWMQRGIIKRLGTEGNKVLVDEADVAYCAHLHKKIGGGFGSRVFRSDGTPWKQLPRHRRPSASNRSHLTPDEREARRQKGLEMLRQGEPQAAVARSLRVSEAAVSGWKKQLKRQR